MATLESIVRYGVNNPIDPGNFAPGTPIRKAAEMQDRVRQIGVEYYREHESIEADRRLSPDGKADKRKVVTRSMVTELVGIRHVTIAVLREHVASLQSKVSEHFRPTTDVVTFLRQREIRDALYALDTPVRFKAFQQAIEAADELIFRAILEAPAVRPLLPEPVLIEGKQLWLRAVDLATATEFDAAQAALAALTENVADVEAGIYALAGIKPPKERAA